MSIPTICSKKCEHILRSRKASAYFKTRPIVWYDKTCVICQKEFKVKRAQLVYGRKTCSTECFKKLCQQHGESQPLLPEECYRIIGEKAATNPKSGPFLTNQGAKDYSLISPKGNVYFIRNLALFIKNNMNLFAGVSKTGRKPSFATLRSLLTTLAPWRKDQTEQWRDWRWYDPSGRGHQPMRTVILSLGSNIEPRNDWIEKAVQEIAALPDVRDLRRSPLYLSDPENVPEESRDQPFLNGIVTFKTRVSDPRKFLKTLQAIEKRLGRKHDAPPGSPRTIDIDIIDIEKMRVVRPELLVPHPRAATRRFVLQPLTDLLPNHRFFMHDETVSDLLLKLSGTNELSRG